jgi:hypothetical protein
VAISSPGPIRKALSIPTCAGGNVGGAATLPMKAPGSLFSTRGKVPLFQWCQVTRQSRDHAGRLHVMQARQPGEGRPRQQTAFQRSLSQGLELDSPAGATRLCPGRKQRLYKQIQGFGEQGIPSETQCFTSASAPSGLAVAGLGLQAISPGVRLPSPELPADVASTAPSSLVKARAAPRRRRCAPAPVVRRLGLVPQPRPREIGDDGEPPRARPWDPAN